jgi:hypothetical protein
MMVAPITSGEGICEWEVAPATTRPDATVTCDPGARLFVGCSASCENGSCSGEPAIRVCDGNTPPAACASDDAVSLADDGGGACSPDDDCPEVALTCPGSGAITVVTRHYWGRDSPYACDWSVRVGGIGD